MIEAFRKFDIEVRCLRFVTVRRVQGTVIRGKMKFEDLDVWRRDIRSSVNIYKVSSIMLIGFIKIKAKCLKKSLN